MTGLIYVILIAVWGVVLVPRWLRRHDEKRDMDNSGALQAALSSEYDHDEDDSGEPGIDEHDSQAGRAATWSEYLTGLVEVDYGRYAKHLRDQAGDLTPTARRRRRILVALATFVGVSLIGVIVGILPGALVVLSTFLLGGYVSAMVIFMRNNAARNEMASNRDRKTATPDAGWEHEASGMAVDGVRVVGTETDRWDPRETTLPTYVTKSKASKIPRRIDLTSGWTGADMVAQAREQQQASPELEQQFDREWAVVAPQPEADVESYANGHADDEGYYRRAVNE